MCWISETFQGKVIEESTVLTEAVCRNKCRLSKRCSHFAWSQDRAGRMTPLMQRDGKMGMGQKSKSMKWPFLNGGQWGITIQLYQGSTPGFDPQAGDELIYSQLTSYIRSVISELVYIAPWAAFSGSVHETHETYPHIFDQSEVDVPFFTVLSPGQVQALPRGERGRLARDGLCQSHRLHGHGHLPAACAFRMGRRGRRGLSWGWVKSYESMDWW